ncbi:hypothetical protein [Paracoccus aminophilus]|uniref:Uncharacterized protein n=1 Tax=Paracoccus aminophilus JCM 7686 TaxID=1367847 RepID=S5Y5Z2_PARAH|nr:hypothetical protein [Paracoccus aminophilus]AGT11090.1 hypothetical protein JCM7686_pAMI5p024 [Paracoccus aminophilus JCM 7686]
MIAKSFIVALAVVAAAPAIASAQSINSGLSMEARLLNVDASAFTANELAVISAEDGNVNQQSRAAYITAEKSRNLSTAIASDDNVTAFGINAPQRVGRD